MLGMLYECKGISPLNQAEKNMEDEMETGKLGLWGCILMVSQILVQDCLYSYGIGYLK